jgi:hypothetical protein
LNIRQVTEPPVGFPGYAGPALQISALALPPMVSIAISRQGQDAFHAFHGNPLHTKTVVHQTDAGLWVDLTLLTIGTGLVSCSRMLMLIQPQHNFYGSFFAPTCRRVAREHGVALVCCNVRQQAAIGDQCNSQICVFGVRNDLLDSWMQERLAALKIEIVNAASLYRGRFQTRSLHRLCDCAHGKRL